MNALQRMARETMLGRLLLLPWRLGCALRVTLPPVLRSFTWTLRSREHYNFTYDLEERNIRQLAAFVAVVAGIPEERAENYLREIAEDSTLRAHVAELTAQSPERHVSDSTLRLGRRMGWYALVRALKPRLVVETGVDKGLGSVTLAAALARNAAEGHPGRLAGLDINPRAGFLLQGRYAEWGRIVVGDSLATLRALTEPVDVFIHDSDHNPEFESAEYAAVAPRLSPHALVLSDNAAHTDELQRFARATGRRFLYFAEKPLHHWWPGEGIGVAFHASQQATPASGQE